MRKIVQILVVPMYESCERTTYYVRLVTDEGFHTEPCAHRTGSVHMEDGVRVVVPGLSLDEARQRALCDAGDWADLLEIPMDPYVEDGVEHKAFWDRNRFGMEREIAKRNLEEPVGSGAETADVDADEDADQVEEA